MGKFVVEMFGFELSASARLCFATRVLADILKIFTKKLHTKSAHTVNISPSAKIVFCVTINTIRIHTVVSIVFAQSATILLLIFGGECIVYIFFEREWNRI